jgi:hypothetical protein
MLGVAQRSAETDHTLDFLVPQRVVRGNAVGVLKFRVAGYLIMAHRARSRFGRLDKRSPDASPLKGRLNMPALDEGNWR